MQRICFVALFCIINIALATPDTNVPLAVVASFSILGDLVQVIGGPQVQVTTLVGPNGDTHVYQPTPNAVQAISQAHLVVINGLKFEGWMERLIKASRFSGQIVIASDGVTPRTLSQHTQNAHNDDWFHHQGNADPHAWQDLNNGMIYVQNITAGLIKVDPIHTVLYQQRSKQYLTQLESLHRETLMQLSFIPKERRKLITSHDAFGYFAAAYGLTILAPSGISTEAEASAADVAALIRQIRTEGVKAIFVENINDPRLMQQIATETGVTLGGMLYSDSLSTPEGHAATYLDMFRHNLRTLFQALIADTASYH